ncbi:MAG: hypothetical protein WC707_02915 [Candidatus Babeliaceae bacterium]
MKHINALSPTIIFLIFFYIHGSQDIQKTITPHIITIFIKPSDTMPTNTPVDKKLNKPGTINRTIIKHHLKTFHNKGVYATYAGFVTHSDNNGQIIFPRKHEKNEMIYVLTQKIKPVILQGNTVNYFIATPQADVAYFKAEQLFDEHKKIYYWHVAQQPVPDNRIIPPLSLHFFVKPEHMVIPEGDFVADNNPNLLLPTVYTTKDITIGTNSLLFLKISKFFSPIKFAYNYTTERYALRIRS